MAILGGGEQDERLLWLLTSLNNGLARIESREQWHESRKGSGSTLGLGRVIENRQQAP